MERSVRTERERGVPGKMVGWMKVELVISRCMPKALLSWWGWPWQVLF